MAKKDGRAASRKADNKPATAYTIIAPNAAFETQVGRHFYDGKMRFVDGNDGVLAGWLSNTRFRAGFVIITRSQKAEAAELAILPPGAVDRIEGALLASPRFTVLYHDRDASVFTLSGTRGAGR